MTNEFILPTQLLDDIDGCLSRFYDRTGVTCVLLTDISGQLITYKETTQDVNLVNLAALAASDMAAVTEMARLVGEKDRFKLLIHEGENLNVLVAEVSENFILVAIFKTSVQIGLVRLFIKETGIRLRDLVEQFEEANMKVSRIIDDDFASSLASELERAFGE